MMTFAPILCRDIVCAVALNPAVDPAEKFGMYTFGGQKLDNVVDGA